MTDKRCMKAPEGWECMRHEGHDGACAAQPNKHALLLTFVEYESQVLHLAAYPRVGRNITYPALGLVGEAGEVCEKVKKGWRNHPLQGHGDWLAGIDAADLTPYQQAEIAKELGDVLWYIAAIAKELGIDLTTVAQMNVDKLTDRAARGVIKSEGDNR